MTEKEVWIVSPKGLSIKGLIKSIGEDNNHVRFRPYLIGDEGKKKIGAFIKDCIYSSTGEVIIGENCKKLSSIKTKFSQENNIYDIVGYDISEKDLEINGEVVAKAGTRWPKIELKSNTDTADLYFTFDEGVKSRFEILDLRGPLPLSRPDRPNERK